MLRKKQGFAVTGSQDAKDKGAKGGSKGGKARVKKGLAMVSPERRSELAKRSWELRRQRAAGL